MEWLESVLGVAMGTALGLAFIEARVARLELRRVESVIDRLETELRTLGAAVSSLSKTVAAPPPPFTNNGHDKRGMPTLVSISRVLEDE